MISVLIAALERHARRRPDALALRELGPRGERTATWRQLRDAASGIAGRLREDGRDLVVMVSAPNRWELLAAMLGGLWADASGLPVAPAVPPAALVELTRRLGVSTVTGEPAVLEALAGTVARRIPIDSFEADASEPDPPRGGSLLLQSSGTTGMPKIVRRRAAALDAVGENCARAIGVDENDTLLLAIPLYHSYGIDLGLLTAIVAGCSIELHDRFDPARVRTALASRAISVLPGVPLMFNALAYTAGEAGRAPSLRRAVSAGSPLPLRVYDRFRAVYGLPIGQIYGTTEFGSATFNDPDEAGFEPESAGRPFRGVELRIVDAEKPRLDRPLPPGEEGQVAVAAPSMLSEYVDAPGAPTTGGFLLTGDLGCLDAAGALRLTGRLKLLIDVGGLKVNPLEVESVLMRHPAVCEAIAVPIFYSDTASRLKAIVILEPGCEVTTEELDRFARERLIHYKVPRSFEIRTAVPRSPTGKILRQELLAAERGA